MKANKLKNKEIPLPTNTASTEELKQSLGEDLVIRKEKKYIKKSICSVKLYRFLNKYGVGEFSSTMASSLRPENKIE
jgi:hypothetical protein|tara:strand:+ start:220 stop:450 length:231 start_codon:yes stop_codon:yes gene_type:complete